MKTRISLKRTGRWFGQVAIAATLLLGVGGVAKPVLPLACDSPPYTFITLAEKALPDSSSTNTAAVGPVKPNSLAVDGQGNLYFTDARHQVICRMTPSGSITIIAGKWNTIGSADGQGSHARFFHPQGIALDASGDLYVADSRNGTIRRVTPAGEVTTLAGKAGESGHQDGAGRAARFNYPSDIAVDGSGTLYVADLYNFVIRKVTPGGVVTTFAGQVGKSATLDGPAGKAEFNSPIGIAADYAGNVYVADMYKNSIRKITPTGRVTTLAGQLSFRPGHVDGTARAAQFFHPYGLAVDGAGNIYVADSDNRLIRRLAPGGEVVIVAGVAGQPGQADGAGSSARFGHPFRIAVDGARNLYITDLDNWAIRKGIATPATNAPVILTRQ